MTSSGDDAIEQAAERAKHTADKNIANLPGLPIADLTANLRQGPDLHDGLLGLLPLVGVWRGEGEGIDPASGTYRFGQQIVVSHDGANHLHWDSRSWVLDDAGSYVKPDASETGFWRISETDEIELLLAHAEGWIELFYGRPLNQTSWNLTTDVVITTESGLKAGGAKRLYGLAPDGDLAFVEERVNPDGDLVPRASAKLARYAG